APQRARVQPLNAIANRFSNGRFGARSLFGAWGLGQRKTCGHLRICASLFFSGPSPEPQAPGLRVMQSPFRPQRQDCLNPSGRAGLLHSAHSGTPLARARKYLTLHAKVPPARARSMRRRPTMLRALIPVALSASMLLAAQAHADVYKYTDEKGNVHYTD